MVANLLTWPSSFPPRPLRNTSPSTYKENLVDAITNAHKIIQNLNLHSHIANAVQINDLRKLSNFEIGQNVLLYTPLQSSLIQQMPLQVLTLLETHLSHYR